MGPSTAPTQSPSLTPQLTTSTPQPLQIMPDWNAWPCASPFLMTPTQPTIYRPSSLEGSHKAPSGSSSHYQSPSPYGIQTLPPSRNSNASVANILTLCMWAGGEYTLSRGSFSSLSKPPSMSSGSDGTSSGSENNAAYAPLRLGSRDGSTSDSSSNLPSSATYEVPSSVMS
ncbi:hypothetical protein PVK06_012144 [Gossypium arboreum]|uniref:Uncharacterized protein n=1 Tax=Gossypium arboreum TaxID=29729 RepID=A0ABR0QBI1_GOSAR|nr:hypothetical protein PVK06_012144 [Gossypium arboreum]